MPDEFEERHDAEIQKLPTLRDEALLKQVRALAELADAEKDVDATARWYDHLLNASSQLGRFDYELAAFHSIRQLYARGPEFDFLRESILWYFKWIVERLPEHAEVSADTIETVLRQMQEFYERERESLRPIYALRCRAAGFMGREDESREYFEKWQTADAGNSSDCPACETHTRVLHLLDQGKPEEAIAVAEPLFNGEQSCAEVPVTTFARLLLPVTMSGNLELANAMHAATVRAARSSPKLLSHLANHVVFLSLTSRAMEARRLAMVMLGRCRAATNSYDRLTAFRAGWIWLRGLRRVGVQAVRLPVRFKPDARTRPVEVTLAADECRAESQALADAFDTRNGNTRFNDTLTSISDMLDKIDDAMKSSSDE